MDEQTTTEAPAESGGQAIQGVAVDDQGMAVPQPDESEQAKAAQTTVEETSTDEPSLDDDTSKWLESKGIDPSSPKAVAKLAKSAREAEKAMHAKAGEASKLKKSMEVAADKYADEEVETTGADPETTRTLKRLLVRDSLRDFWEANPGAKEHEAELAQIVTERPYLAGDLEAAYALVQSKNAGDLKSQGKREALESLAQKQQAAVPSGNAVNPQGGGTEKITPQNVDRLVAQNDQQWFEKHYKEINTAMAG